MDLELKTEYKLKLYFGIENRLVALTLPLIHTLFLSFQGKLVSRISMEFSKLQSSNTYFKHIFQTFSRTSMARTPMGP